MSKMEKKNMAAPEEVRTFPKGKVELVKIGEFTVGKATFESGWKWSESVKPIAKTHSCQAPHTNFHLSGKLRVRMDDGTEVEFGPGEVGMIPPGHDAWVVGNEPAIMYDITGMINYAK
jgi:hypothetical protein